MLSLRAVNSAFKNRGLSQMQRRSLYELPRLPYKYHELEPIISQEIMELHYQKHHAGYVNNLNSLLTQLNEAIKDKDLDKVVALQRSVQFNAGGHINHSIFWRNLCPPDLCKPPAVELSGAIADSFGSFEKFVADMSNMAISIQGSGWAWLAYNRRGNNLQLHACKNQDPLEPTTGLIPLLGIDVWEHAYYLQYKNARANYVNKIWEVINWQDVANRFAQAKKKKGKTVY